MLLLYFPVLAMRSLAEERRARTDQLLLTSPVSVWGIVVGKYLALCTVFALPCLADGIMIVVLWLPAEESLLTCLTTLCQALVSWLR